MPRAQFHLPSSRITTKGAKRNFKRIYGEDCTLSDEAMVSIADALRKRFDPVSGGKCDAMLQLMRKAQPQSASIKSPTQHTRPPMRPQP